MRILLLGVGMQGIAALYDLVHCEDVDEIIATDKDINGLISYVESCEYGNKVQCEKVDAGNLDSLNKIISASPDVIIDLLPSDFIDNVTTAAVKNGVHLVNTFFLKIINVFDAFLIKKNIFSLQLLVQERNSGK